MPTQYSYSIGTVASLVVPASDGIQQVVLHNHEHASNHDIYYGNSAVTVDSGLHLLETETHFLSVAAGDTVWAIADGTNRAMRVLISRM
jgi:hypothetical protein